jgi:secreted PhoX family phosphatase
MRTRGGHDGRFGTRDTKEPTVDTFDVNGVEFDSEVTRRNFLQGAMAGAAAITLGDTRALFAALADDKDAVMAQVDKQHASTVKALQDWIALPTIAAENKNYPAGPEYMAKLAREAGFQKVELVPTKAGHAGVFAQLDAGPRPRSPST